MIEVRREEVVAAEPREALARLLDLDVPTGDEVPELWHWLHLLERPATADLGPDGHPVVGIPVPPGPGMRRMFAGGRVQTLRRLRIGRPAVRTTRVVGEVTKEGRSGPLRFVTVRHEVRQAGELAVVDEQDLVYRTPGGQPAPEAAAALGAPDAEATPSARDAALALQVDEALLFRFSALTYNGHRIHYDRAWCRHEGYDDLVVHGPLQALMMSELLRRNGVGLVGRTFSYRLVAPMVGTGRLDVVAAAGGLGSGAEAYGAGRRTAVCTVA